MRGFLFILLCLGAAAHGAGLTATLKPRTLIQGKSAQLTIRCEGYELATIDPERTPPGMGFAFRGRDVHRATVNGTDAVAVTFTYLVTITKPGRHVLPSFTAKLPNGDLLRSEPLTFTVLDRDGGTPLTGQQTGFIKVQIDQQKLFLGGAFSVTMK